MSTEKKLDAHYFELCDKLKTVKYGKEARKLHKELKAYGSGLPMFARYPRLPLIVSIICLLLLLCKPVLLGILQ